MMEEEEEEEEKEALDLCFWVLKVANILK